VKLAFALALSARTGWLNWCLSGVCLRQVDPKHGDRPAALVRTKAEAVLAMLTPDDEDDGI
jgi:hypothetical protein